VKAISDHHEVMMDMCGTNRERINMIAKIAEAIFSTQSRAETQKRTFHSQWKYRRFEGLGAQDWWKKWHLLF
jgi:hypothetical protein